MSNSGTIKRSVRSGHSTRSVRSVKPSSSDKTLIPESKTPTYEDFLKVVKECDLVAFHKLKPTSEMINKKDKYGHPPLYYAASNGHIGMVRNLIWGGADINLGYPTALFGAAENGHLEIVMFLKTNGADLNKATRGYTPLGIAIKNKRGRVVKYLEKLPGIKTRNYRYNPYKHMGPIGFGGRRRSVTRRRTTRSRSTRRRSARN